MKENLYLKDGGRYEIGRRKKKGGTERSQNGRLTGSKMLKRALLKGKKSHRLSARALTSHIPSQHKRTELDALITSGLKRRNVPRIKPGKKKSQKPLWDKKGRLRKRKGKDERSDTWGGCNGIREESRRKTGKRES